MSNKGFIDLLIRLIELKPEFEDEKWNGIKILWTNIYVKNWKIVAIVGIIIIIISICMKGEISNKLYEVFVNF